MISFERIEINNTSYEDQNRIGEVSVFQTSTWLNFLAEVQKAEPIITAIKPDDVFLGYFIGLISHKIDLKILGSPFRG